MTTPIREGLFRESDTGPTLLAGECAACGRTTFPSTGICPECGGEEGTPFALGDTGELLCATVVHMGAAGFAASLHLKIGDLDQGAPELRPDSRYNLDNDFIIRNYSTSSDVLGSSDTPHARRNTVAAGPKSTYANTAWYSDGASRAPAK